MPTERPAVQPTPATPGATDRADRVRAWYRDHGAAVYNYVRYHVASPDAAEDLTAETFLRALQAADRFDPATRGERPWLITIARNLLRDHRRRARVRQYVNLHALRDLASHAPSPEERLLYEEEAGRALDALAGLDAADREIVSLRYASGLSGPEIAALLGISEANARVRLWRAMARLRTALGEIR
ncbi:MAG TPA: sigma-70 family RNA polymerase sigma factor [Gemmatimonadales bacterium]|jgi:RNA polymerase sigma-70 factor (ECF subfamily)|nr:sigma-70 family RNA polymerase sigma factor [Gemmatimonadales bacterium]